MESAEDAIVMHALYRKGWSISQIAREFDVNWRTARRYALAETPPTYRKRRGSAELTPAQLAHVERRLAGCPTVRSSTLHRELLELGYVGSCDSLRRRVAVLRPVSEREPEVRFETGPGVQLQADWADCGPWLVGSELVPLFAFVCVLGYSRMVAVRFAFDKTRDTTLRRLVGCVDDLGGVPGEILTDRDPALVIGRTPKDRPVFAPEWIDLAATLGTTARACRAYRAKTKGKVERVVREVKEDFLCWLTGQPLPPRPGLHDYDTLVRRWALEVVATRTHRTTKRVVGEAWEQERALLRPLAARIRATVEGTHATPTNVVDLTALRTIGATVEQRALADYEAAGS